MVSRAITPKKIKKRDGRIVDFDPSKIAKAISKAGEATGEFARQEAKRLTGIVIPILVKASAETTPTVEQVQDIVEQVLMAASHYQAAKAYILYRKRRADLRAARQVIGVEDDLGMPMNALKAMAQRYLTRDARGNVIETPRQAVDRVARTVASVEKRKRKTWEKRFTEMIASFQFVPAGCYFRGAGRKRGLLANCFVLPVEDDMGAIFDAVKWAALIQQAGGGTGYNFSHLRAKGDVVAGGGFASGPVSFMKVFDAATGIVMLGGHHRGANMGILNADHPDIFEFVSCKTLEGEITNFNISLGASDAFMKAVEKNQNWDLVNARTGDIVQTVGARKIFDQAVGLAWKTGDPGMIYLDQINRNNPLLEVLGPIEATNVCGEQPLHPFDVCNLGSINLAKFIRDTRGSLTAWTRRESRRAQDDKRDLKSLLRLSRKGAKKVDERINWRNLEEIVRLAVRFLDDGIDASEYPIVQIAKMAHQARRVGLGIMGWADMLVKLGIRYDSEEAVRLASRLMKFIQEVGWDESAKLASEKGAFPLWGKSSFVARHPVLGKRGGRKGVKVRNVAITTIAPTGTISMLANCSSGIEPIFALAYVKNVVDQEGMTYTNKFFEQVLYEAFADAGRPQVESVLHEVSKIGSVADVEDVPFWIKAVFRTAHDISPAWHVGMQAAFQKYTDNAVSKTINFPESATVEDIERAYMLAWETGCKGITIYRNKSKTLQILELKTKEKLKQRIQSRLSVVPLVLRTSSGSFSTKTQADVCPECGEAVYFAEGCSSCPQCGYSKCEV